MFEVARLLFSGTEPELLLRRIAEEICARTGYRRCLIAGVDGGLSGEIRGRAGFGLRQSDIMQVEEMLADVPVITEVLRSGQLIVLASDQLRAAIPHRYLSLFDVTGNLAVVPLTDARFGPLGMLFLDGAPSDRQNGPREQQILTDFAQIATLTIQNEALVHDRSRLVAVLERSRLASELHDGVTQRLFTLGLALQELADLPDLPAAAGPLLERAQRDVDTGSSQLRRALVELTQQENRRGTEGTMSFETRLRSIVDDFHEDAGIGADVEVRGQGAAPHPEVCDLLLRAARESLANVTKHASATQVTVLLRRSDHHWVLEVHDDGEGAANTIRRRSSHTDHYGLRSLRIEAQRVGGRLWVSQSTLLGGVQVTLSVQVAP